MPTLQTTVAISCASISIICTSVFIAYVIIKTCVLDLHACFYIRSWYERIKRSLQGIASKIQQCFSRLRHKKQEAENCSIKDAHAAGTIVSTALNNEEDMLNSALYSRFEPFEERERFFNVSVRLQFFVTIAMLFNCIFYLLANLYVAHWSDTMEDRHNNSYCQLFGFMHQFTIWLILGYNVFIAIWVFSWIAFGKKLKQFKPWKLVVLEIASHTSIVSVATFFGIVPFFPGTSTYGVSGTWCWVRTDVDNAVLLQMLSYFVPLWVLWIFTAIIYAITFIIVFRSYARLRHVGTIVQCCKIMQNLCCEFQSYLQNLDQESDTTTVDETQHQFDTNLKHQESIAEADIENWKYEMKVYGKLILVPAIFIGTWIIPTINRVRNLIITETTDQFLMVGHVVCVLLQGTFTTMAFFFDPFTHMYMLKQLLDNVFIICRRHFCCCCCCCKSISERTVVGKKSKIVEL